MRYPGLRASVAGCVLLFSAIAQAVTFEIDTSEDVPVHAERVGSGEDARWKVIVEQQDGLCSLREALYAINYRQPVDGCEAGSGNNDVIRLQPGETYLLEHGELPVGGGKRVGTVADEDGELPDQPLNSRLRIELKLEPFARAVDEEPAVITSEGQSRLFNVAAASALNISYTTLTDGQAPADENGGLILSSGSVLLGEGTRLHAGVAELGGAVFLQQRATLSFPQSVLFENNRASHGSVIASAEDFAGGIEGVRFTMADNVAEAGKGAIYLNGNDEQPVFLVLSDGTFTNNQGDVIWLDAPYRVTDLANLTLAFNDGTALYFAQSAFPAEDVPEDGEGASEDGADQGGEEQVAGADDEAGGEDEAADDEPLSQDVVLHTVIVGNDIGCVLAGDPDTASQVTRFLFTATDDSACPEPAPGTTLNTDPNNASASLLLGLNEQGERAPCPEDAIGAGSCVPLPAEQVGGPFPAFLPNPLHGEGDITVTALLDRAAPETEVTNQCSAIDMRGKPRRGIAGRCDIGAVEFIPAQSRPKEIKMISGQTVVADVLEDVLNDTLVDCGRVAQGEPCLRAVIEPERGSVDVIIDEQGYPRLRYTPRSHFHGVDSLRYVAHRDAFIGGTDGGLDLSDRVNFVSEPASGLTKSESAGAGGGLALACLGLLLALRRLPVVLTRRFSALLAALLVAISLPVQAAEITVNSLADHNPPVLGDGQCTLREALQNAAGGDPSPDCAFGDKTGTDTIILPAGTIELAAPLEVRGGNVAIQGRSPREDDDQLTLIKGNGSFRLFQVQQQGVGNAYPSVIFRQLRLEGGAAVTGDGLGGVISTGGNLTFERVVAANNRAAVAGGVAMIRTSAGNAKSVTINRSYFFNNQAVERGGVLASNPAPGERLTVRISDSTFADNEVTAGSGGALDLRADDGSPMQISNTVFINNQADSGTGAVADLSNFIPRVNLMNVTLVSDDNSQTGFIWPDASLDSGDRLLANSVYLGFADAGCVLQEALDTSVFNLFDCDPDAETDSDGNDYQGERNVLAAQLSPDSGTGSGYVPAFLPVADPQLDNLIINQGNDGELASGTSSPQRCRSQDMRGIPRTAGERCDRGAVEFQEITAVDDEGSNRDMPDRRATADILANDIPSDGAEIVLLDADGNLLVDRLEFAGYSATEDNAYEDASGNRIEMVWEFYNPSRDGFAVRCGEPLPQLYIDNVDGANDGDVAEQCVMLFVPANEGHDLDVCRPVGDSRDPYQQELEYRFTDDAGEQSEFATVTLTIRNKPPIITEQTKINRAGESVVFDLEVRSPDGSEILWDTLRVKNHPRFASKDQSGDSEGLGILLNTPAQGQVTYIPENNFNTFRDSFSLEISDDCGSASRAATFRIRYPDSSAHGSNLTGGSMPIVMIALVLLAWRRRRH